VLGVPCSLELFAGVLESIEGGGGGGNCNCSDSICSDGCGSGFGGDDCNGGGINR